MPKAKKKISTATKSKPRRSLSKPKGIFYFWIGCIGFLMALLVFYLVSMYGNKHSVQIGLMYGDASSIQAANLAADQINAQGGLLVGGTKFPVKVIMQNKQEVPRAVQSLIDEGVLAIIGPDASSAAMEAKSLANSQQVLLLPTVCADSCNESFMPSGNVSATDSFLVSFEKTYDTPADVAAVLTYNAMQQVFLAIQKNGGFDRAGLLQLESN